MPHTAETDSLEPESLETDSLEPESLDTDSISFCHVGNSSFASAHNSPIA